MIYGSAICFIIAMAAAGVSFVSGSMCAADIAKVLFFLFAILFVLLGAFGIAHRAVCIR